MTAPLMPKATAVWLVDYTTLTFHQIAKFCEIHELEIQAIADGDIAYNIQGLSPINNGQLSWEEIKRCEADPTAELVANVLEKNVKERNAKAKKVLSPFVAVGKAFKKAIDGGVKTINKVSDDINAASKSKDIEDQQYTCLILLFYLDALASFLGLNEEQ